MHTVRTVGLSAALLIPLCLGALVIAERVPLANLDTARLKQQALALWDGTPAESSPSYDTTALQQLTGAVEDERGHGRVLLAELRDLVVRENGLASPPDDLADRIETVQQQVEVATRVRDSTVVVGGLYAAMESLQVPGWYQGYLERARTAAAAEAEATGRFIAEKQATLAFLEVLQAGTGDQPEWDRLQAEIAERHDAYVEAEQDAQAAAATAAAYFQAAASRPVTDTLTAPAPPASGLSLP